MRVKYLMTVVVVVVVVADVVVEVVVVVVVVGVDAGAADAVGHYLFFYLIGLFQDTGYRSSFLFICIHQTNKTQLDTKNAHARFDFSSHTMANSSRHC